MDAYILGKRLKELRKQKRVSQYQLADRSGCPRSTIAMIETGQRKLSEDAITIAKVLGCTPEYLVGLSDTPNEIAKECLSPLGIDAELYRNITEEQLKIVRNTIIALL